MWRMNVSSMAGLRAASLLGAPPDWALKGLERGSRCWGQGEQSGGERASFFFQFLGLPRLPPRWRGRPHARVCARTSLSLPPPRRLPRGLAGRGFPSTPFSGLSPSPRAPSPIAFASAPRTQPAAPSSGPSRTAHLDLLPHSGTFLPPFPRVSARMAPPLRGLP